MSKKELEQLLYEAMEIQGTIEDIGKQAYLATKPSRMANRLNVSAIKDLHEKIDHVVGDWIEIIIAIKLCLHQNEEKK
jgi:uncharacterized protein (DUF169 family)